MQKKVVLSVDAMGGANAPAAVIAGASIAVSKEESLFIRFYGDISIVEPLVRKYKKLTACSEVVHSPKWISDDEPPVRALKVGANSSMRNAIEALKSNDADACVSAGNTGALMVMSKLVLGDLPGIKRPAIVGILPSMSGQSVMLDLGANAECDPHHLLQFAFMGDCFARVALNKKHPSIGLLNIGTEEIKGRELEKKTYQLLQKSGLNFIGYVEGHDIALGKADVVVTDGFCGNIALKTAEGAISLALTLIKNGLQSNYLAKVGSLFVKDAIKDAFKSVDPNKNNGAMFIGVNGIVVKSHGSAGPEGIANAIQIAYDLARKRVNQRIVEELERSQESVGSNIVARIKQTSAKILGIPLTD
ncbi:phosphate acyltransferase PlsX [Rickettsiales endosymbiont of Peranema trichophorum]|uniref:phosphate acyltransferase PlsX n=1 Tax=Rickettsiales endosymbiont of Peranema trichophorum TaxID=2486577 RepID=UPI0010236F6A|nr:phosphate acyltransferase PlsX [Rickettsiales endosymbiont of Peranema trichophorum]RZI47526.1 phosphate acyltransferase PlsX [Rickettsiales endosymbiont of Peranema trichophorum]